MTNRVDQLHRAAVDVEHARRALLEAEAERDSLIIDAYRDGMTQSEIATLTRVSRGRVAQILGR